MRSLTHLTYLCISLVIAVLKSNSLKHGHCKHILFSIAVAQPIMSEYFQIGVWQSFIMIDHGC